MRSPRIHWLFTRIVTEILRKHIHYARTPARVFAVRTVIVIAPRITAINIQRGFDSMGWKGNPEALI